MKKRFVIFSLSVCLVSLVGCKWNVPQKVTVKSNAEYNFTVGKVSKNLSDSVDLSKTLSDSLSTNNAKIYDYYPNELDSAVQKYLMEMPIKDIELDFGKYFEGLNVAGDIQGLSHSETFTVPNVNGQTATSKVDLTGLQTIVNNTLAAILSTGSASVTIEGSTAGLSSVTYGNGAVLTFVIGPSQYEREITFKGVSKKFIGSSVTLDIPANTTIEATDRISLKDSEGNFIESGNNGVSISGNPTKVTGMQYSKPIPIRFPECNVSVGSETFKSATIGTGTMQLSFEGDTEYWSNVKVDYTIIASGGITDSNGNPLSIEKTGLDITNTLDSVSLNGDKLLPEDITIEPKEIELDLSAGGAKITFAANNPSITIKAGFNITKLSSMQAYYDGKVTVSKSESLSSDIIKMVKSITLTRGGVEGTYINTLPAENNITLKTKSDFFGINESAGRSLTSTTQKETLSVVNESSKTITINESPAVDFNAEIVLPGYKKNEGDPKGPYIELRGIEPGETYTIGFDLKPVIDWEEITIDASSYSQRDSINTGINLTSLFSGFESALGSGIGGKLKLKSLPVYLYCSKPSAGGFSDVKFNGKIKMYYQDVTNDVKTAIPEGETYLLGTSSASAEMNLVSVPELDKVVIDKEKGTYFVKTDIAAYPSSVAIDINDLISANIDKETYPNASLAVDYNLGIGGANGEFTIFKSDLEGDTTSAIKITALIVLPLQFVTTDEISLDIMKMMGKDGTSDLFGRSEAMDTSTIDKYLGAISSVSLNYKCDELPFYAIKPLELKVALDGNPENAHSYSFGQGSIVLDYDEINSLLGTYPLAPSVVFCIPATTFSIPREIAISTALGLNIKTDGSVSFDFGGNK
ncbi:MAG: hypothetical protein SPE59_04465 [Treponema sp.]|nr:hypothetical protein [Treponema sp.]